MREDVCGAQDPGALLKRVEAEVIGRDDRVIRLVLRSWDEGRLYLDVCLRPAGYPEFCLSVSLSSAAVRAGDVASLVSSILWAAEHAARVQVVTPLEYTRSFRVTA